MDTYETTDETLLQIKSDLSKEYFFFKKKMQVQKEKEEKSNLIGNFIYDLIDKQHLLIQELYGKYNKLKAEHSMKKMLIANKAEVLKEVHLNVLNRLLEKNYHQENLINDLTNELSSLKAKEEKLGPFNPIAYIPISTEAQLFADKKSKVVNVYKYNEKKKTSANLTLNTTASSHKINDSSARVKMNESVSNKDIRINNLKVKLNLVPKNSLSLRKKA